MESSTRFLGIHPTLRMNRQIVILDFFIIVNIGAVDVGGTRLIRVLEPTPYEV